jgi:hypothetical protein
MIWKATSLFGTFLLIGGASCNLTFAQPPRPTILVIDLENFVEYQADIFDVSKFATNPNETPSVGFRNFSVATVLGDIVAVNGQPVKGLYAARARSIGTSPTPDHSVGGAIADVTRTAIREELYEILQSDGASVGVIVTSGLSGGSAPPGSPLAATTASFAIVGGAGAFLGVRGQASQSRTSQTVPGRAASMAEDPGNRRINGGGKIRRMLTLFPMFVPQMVTRSDGPAVFHSDFTAVTAAKPARPSEVLIGMATGMGPTRPGIDPGQPFPPDSEDLQAVNSPVEVMMNGQSVEVINAIGWPGLTDTYRVDFRIPAGVISGTATIQLSVAWIAGPAVNIQVQ